MSGELGFAALMSSVYNKKPVDRMVCFVNPGRAKWLAYLGIARGSTSLLESYHFGAPPVPESDISPFPATDRQARAGLAEFQRANTHSMMDWGRMGEPLSMHVDFEPATLVIIDGNVPERHFMAAGKRARDMEEGGLLVIVTNAAGLSPRTRDLMGALGLGDGFLKIITHPMGYAYLRLDPPPPISIPSVPPVVQYVDREVVRYVDREVVRHVIVMPEEIYPVRGFLDFATAMVDGRAVADVHNALHGVWVAADPIIGLQASGGVVYAIDQGVRALAEIPGVDRRGVPLWEHRHVLWPHIGPVAHIVVRAFEGTALFAEFLGRDVVGRPLSRWMDAMFGW